MRLQILAEDSIGDRWLDFDTIAPEQPVVECVDPGGRAVVGMQALEQAAIDVAGIDATENGAVPGSIAAGALVDQPCVELSVIGIHSKLLTTAEGARSSVSLAWAD